MERKTDRSIEPSAFLQRRRAQPPGNCRLTFERGAALSIRDYLSV